MYNEASIIHFGKISLFSRRIASALIEAQAHLLAPRHCLVCGEPLVEQTLANQLENNTPTLHPAVVHLVSPSVCLHCQDRFQPAPSPALLINRLFGDVGGNPAQITSIAADDVALSSVTALYQFSGGDKSGDEGSDEISNTAARFAEVVYALKYGGQFQLGEDFGRELGLLLLRSSGENYHARTYDAIVPVPLHTTRERERGFNQADAVALGVASMLGVAIETRWIRRHRITTSQTLLTMSQRRINVQEAFEVHPHLHQGWRKSWKQGWKQSWKESWKQEAHSSVHKKQPLRGKSILLVDDVYTTGSTLNACANVLLMLGARRVDAATLASA